MAASACMNKVRLKFYFYYHLRNSRGLICRAVYRAGRDRRRAVVIFYNCPNTSWTDGSGANMNTRILIQVVLRKKSLD